MLIFIFIVIKFSLSSVVLLTSTDSVKSFKGKQNQVKQHITKTQ